MNRARRARRRPPGSASRAPLSPPGRAAPGTPPGDRTGTCSRVCYCLQACDRRASQPLRALVAKRCGVPGVRALRGTRVRGAGAGPRVLTAPRRRPRTRVPGAGAWGTRRSEKPRVGSGARGSRERRRSPCRDRREPSRVPCGSRPRGAPGDCGERLSRRRGGLGGRAGLLAASPPRASRCPGGVGTAVPRLERLALGV
jgi:hypothetical protein